ncbi:SOS response-associated peptidase [Methylococcus mesophilus]|uniref:SOS response-associated peptidase n=1 Tax=Methylococcus mesophilus TaxID=2993564 RepID=UPI00224AD09C|nr:SOS response-associated peptidase [Methylococcus mesophilus]UZR29050.1 SOS response-associated peptidase [Methylococcus mesophilus]
MCGRYTLTTPADKYKAQLKYERARAILEKLFARYNIAPTQDVAAVRTGTDGVRELVALHWGLIPSWSKESKTTFSTINAKSETVAEKPAFRGAFRHRRCLILADGYYEWQARPGSRAKQPWYIKLAGGDLFAFAGLWERWEPKPNQPGEPIESCSIIVTDANELMRPIHDRMPVILDPAAYDVWLDPDCRDKTGLLSLLRPYPADEMTAWKVSTHVNSPRHDDAECLEPIEAAEG